MIMNIGKTDLFRFRIVYRFKNILNSDNSIQCNALLCFWTNSSYPLPKTQFIHD